MRGCARNASSQSASLTPRQISSDAASSAASSRSGLPRRHPARPRPRPAARQNLARRFALRQSRSTARAFRLPLPRSRRLAQSLEKLHHQVPHHRRAISRRRANIVDRPHFASPPRSRRARSAMRRAICPSASAPFPPAAPAPARRFPARSARPARRPCSTRASAAMQIFEIACALRVPTFRVCCT